MTSYRQLRRNGRRARRVGLQPIMVINTDGQFPTPMALVLARVAWRYRSELAPVFTACATLGAGWWAHLTHPTWWPYLLGVAVASVGVLVPFGARLGLPRLAERVYAGTVASAVAGWLAAAALLGPLTPPLPQILSIGAAVLAVPWWAHRRRRAKVHVQRTLAAWPDISRAIGLPGSQVMSADVDLWDGGHGSAWPAGRPSPM
jgi:hypothetical protein